MNPFALPLPVWRRHRPSCATLALAALSAVAATSARPAAAAAQPTPEWQIASALLALPEGLRDGAEVRAWTDDGHLVTLRAGSNGLICLADRPGDDDRFHAACYHESLEPFMERGRQLAREGVEGRQRYEIRWAEIEAGTLPMPDAAMVYNLWLPDRDFDPASIGPASGRRLHALYMRDATPESTGLSPTPGPGAWLMHPGTPSAHVMMAVPNEG
jgi:hypothetical protein